MSDIVKLQKDLEDLKKAADLSLVENAITYLRQLISRPAAVFDPFATMAALEQVVNVAREKGDDRASKYLVILRQCRPLTNSNALRSILTKLVASKEEAEVAKVVEKALKNSSPGRFARNGPPYPPYFNPRGRRGNPQFQRPRASVKCYTCGQFGYIARFCSKRPNPTL